jgi:hypothetical protein
MEREALKQIIDFLQPVAALAEGNPFENSEVIERCVEASKIALQVLAQPVRWVGLTDEEKDGKRVLENGLLFNAAEVQAWELGVEYAEAKLKEKNT